MNPEVVDGAGPGGGAAFVWISRPARGSHMWLVVALEAYLPMKRWEYQAKTGWNLEYQSPVAYAVAVQHLLHLRMDFRMQTSADHPDDHTDADCTVEERYFLGCN